MDSVVKAVIMDIIRKCSFDANGQTYVSWDSVYDELCDPMFQMNHDQICDLLHSLQGAK